MKMQLWEREVRLGNLTCGVISPLVVTKGGHKAKIIIFVFYGTLGYVVKIR